MKKIFTLLLAVFALQNVSAQFLSYINDPDTLRISYKSGTYKQFLSWYIDCIDLSDPKNVVVKQYGGQSDAFLRASIKDLRFYSRYGNPEKLLASERFGAYETLFQMTRHYDTSFYFTSCVSGDEMLGSGFRDVGWANVDYLSPNVLSYNRSYWASYNSIDQLNHLLDIADGMSGVVDQKELDHAKGEILFLRAYHHYELASLYGPVSVINDKSSWEQQAKTFTAEMTWGHIMLDLKNAINLMDGSMCPSLKEDGRVSRFAAEAMLARAFLFYTGFYQGKHDIAAQDASVKLPDGSTLTKKDVVDYLSDCINNSPFKLVSDYRNLWPYTNRYTVEANPETANKGLKWVEDDYKINPEVLFKVKYNTKASWEHDFAQGYANLFALLFGVNINKYNGSNVDFKDAFPLGGGWGAGCVSQSLYDDWAKAEPSDMRRNASIQDVSSYTSNMNIAVQETNLHEKKISPIIGVGEDYRQDKKYNTFELFMYYDYNGPITRNSFQHGSTHPLNLIRFSDVLLMHSELTGTTDGINKVRARAGLSPLAAYSLEALQQERRWELAFEGVRWNDMRRWGDDYCKAALDKQLNQPIIMKTGKGLNTPENFGEKRYSERYAETHGFLENPQGNGDCLNVYKSLNGDWYLGSVNGVTYGTLTYKGASSADFVSKLTGLVKGYSFDEMKKTVSGADAEIANYARMSINENNIAKISARGDTIAKGNITLHETFNYDWCICNATVTNNAVLGADKCSKFDIISLDNNTMVLVETASAKAETRFWVYKRGDICQKYMQNLANKKWAYCVGMTNTYNYEKGGYEYVGPWGYCSKGNVYNSIWVSGLNAAFCEGASPAQLMDYANKWGLKDKREADPYAYMMFDLYDETVSKYARNGELIAKGKFNIEYSNGYITLTVENNATLFPYSFYGEGETVNKFYLYYFETGGVLGAPDENFALITPSNSDEFTFWSFALRGIAPEEVDDQVVIEQYDKNDKPAADGCYLKYTFKDGRNRASGFECVDGTRLVWNNGTVRLDAPKGSTVEKDIRFWFVNCNNDTISFVRKLKFKMEPKP